MINIQTHLNLLGMRCVDKVTGMTGVITSISFDLSGCIQALLHPGLNDKGEQMEVRWFDVARLRVIDGPVMEQPDFIHGPVAEGKKGAAEKPSMSYAKR